MEPTTADRALELLKEGNKRFVGGQLSGTGRDISRSRELVDAQYPYALVLCCADSRVVPEFLFDTGLGNLFVVRVAGNVANPSSIASVEFAVVAINVKLILVMGHENCAAVTAACKGVEAGPNVELLLSYIAPAIDAIGTRDVNPVARASCTINAEKMIAESKLIRDAMKTGGVRVATAFYNLGSGVVDFDEPLG